MTSMNNVVLTLLTACSEEKETIAKKKGVVVVRG